MELVTGFAGKAHITSAQTGTFNAGVVGGGSYVMPTGEKLTATIITNNLIRVLDGDIVMNGRHITIPKGTYEELEIANGLQGMKRNDLIVARYEKDANTGIETASLVVIQGTSTDETASDPEYNDNDIAEGTLISDMPLYRITLDGLAVGEPEPLFTVAKSMEELKNCISVLENTTDELNNKLDNNLDQYTDDEVVVGTWFGRPKYRKTYVYTGVSMTLEVPTKLTSNAGVIASAIVSINGMVVDSSRGDAFSDGMYVQFALVANELYVYQAFTASLPSAAVYVTLEYIK